MRATGNTVLMTGGTSGIGRALAEARMPRLWNLPPASRLRASKCQPRCPGTREVARQPRAVSRPPSPDPDSAVPITAQSQTRIITEAIRPVAGTDVPAIKAVIDATGLFPAELLDDMIAGYLAGQGGDDVWLTVDGGGPGRDPVAVVYVAPERMTSGTWNLYLIAVHPAYQSRGIGAALVHHVERALAARGARVLLVETSGLPAFERTRAFYRANGYDDEARIREFYAAGEDKVVFRKALILA